MACARQDKDLLGKVDGEAALEALLSAFNKRYWIAILFGRLPAQQGTDAPGAPPSP